VRLLEFTHDPWRAQRDPELHFDTIVTDAPYGLGITRNTAANGEASAIGFDSRVWAELRRVTKPGGLLGVYGHPRTAHRQTVALKDAGWKVIDTLAWVESHGYQAGNRIGICKLRES
jgi:DNA modification methylase